MGLAEALRARLREHSGTNHLADSVARHHRSVNERFDRISRRLDRLETLASIASTMAAIEIAPPAAEPLISVIIPTHNRARLLRRAIRSVLDQAHANLELIVVDDGSDDETPAMLRELDDPRVRTLRIERGGAGAARNEGLGMATGDLVAYLDDDNVMHPSWLRSVAWAFEREPEAEVAYGAILIDDPNNGRDPLPRAMPAVFLNPFERDRLAEDNLADISAIAHRAGLTEARFDPTLVTMGDWDLLARLTTERDPVVVPAIACLYTTDAPERLTGGPTSDADAATVRERARSLRPAG